MTPNTTPTPATPPSAHTEDRPRTGAPVKLGQAQGLAALGVFAAHASTAMRRTVEGARQTLDSAITRTSVRMAEFEMLRALRAGDAKTVAELAAIGVDPLAPLASRLGASGGTSPLHEMVRHGMRETVQLTIQKLSARGELHRLDAFVDAHGRTPAKYAADLGFWDIALDFVKAGANPNLRDAGTYASRLPESVFETACWGRVTHAIETLLASGRVDARQQNAAGFPVACAAATEDQTDGVALFERFVAHGLDPHQRFGEMHYDFLHIAATRGDTDLIRHLIERHGLVVDSPDAAGDTPLMVAARYGQPGAIRELIAHGAFIEFQNRNGQRPMHAAAACHRPERASRVIGELARAGARINPASGGPGSTPRGYAQFLGHRQVAHFFDVLQARRQRELTDRAISAIDRARTPAQRAAHPGA